MKKISRKIYRFIRGIFRLIDYFIINPVTKLFLWILSFFKGNGKELEKFLTKRQTLVVVSLLFAVLMFYGIDKKFITLVNNSAEVLSGQPIVAIYNEESYVIEGLPETAEVTLIGRKYDVYLAKQYPQKNITVDLKELKPGDYTIDLNYKQVVSSVEYKVNPSTARIVIYEKVSETRELTADIIHKDKLDSKLSIESITLSRDEVIIKGPAYKLAKVATVKALVDIDNISKIAVGNASLTNINLVAYDKNGQVVDVEIVPESVDAVIKISSPSKKVPIKIITEGNLENKAIKTITSSISEVTIYGSSSVLSTIEYIPVNIDVTGINSNKSYTINLTRPSGIREMSTQSITVDIVIDEVVSKEISGIKLNGINLKEGYAPQAIGEGMDSITIIVKGSQSVINALDTSAIVANIDLTGLTTGEHEVKVEIIGPDNRLTYTPRVKTVKIRIIKVS